MMIQTLTLGDAFDMSIIDKSTMYVVSLENEDRKVRRRGRLTK